MNKRVVVTGLGVISPLGNNIIDLWKNLENGNTGISKIKHFDTANFEIKVAGVIDNFFIDDFIKNKLVFKFDNFIKYGLASGIQAIEDSNINNYKKINKNDVGFVIGSGMCGMSSMEENYQLFLKDGFKNIKPNFITNCLINTISGYLSILYGFTGPNISVSTACATGGHAICIADQLIRCGKAKIVVAGGAEHATLPFIISGFLALKTLSKNSDPKKASRPWDFNRDGFVISDGSACLVLEDYDHAINRNCNIYAELVGSSFNSDAYHIVRPDLSGNGIYSCMKNVLDFSKIDISDIGYINAHATSTKQGDLGEGNAIKKLLSKKKSDVSICSTKSLSGHLLGAAGALEAVITVLSLKRQLIIANSNLDNIDDNFLGLNLISKNKKSNFNYAISNSLGFCGTNSSIIFKKL